MALTKPIRQEPTSNSTSTTSMTISATTTTTTTTTVVVSTPQPAFLPPLTNGCNSCVGLGAVPLSTYSECVASNPMVTAQIIAKDSGCGMDAYGIHYTLYSAAGVDWFDCHYRWTHPKDDPLIENRSFLTNCPVTLFSHDEPNGTSKLISNVTFNGTFTNEESNRFSHSTSHSPHPHYHQSLTSWSSLTPTLIPMTCVTHFSGKKGGKGGNTNDKGGKGGGSCYGGKGGKGGGSFGRPIDRDQSLCSATNPFTYLYERTHRQIHPQTYPQNINDTQNQQQQQQE